MYKFLHETSPGTFYMDHRLTPEVRSMFAAMASRAPVGGIQARYVQVVESVAEEMWVENGLPNLPVSWAQAKAEAETDPTWASVGLNYSQAENRLCEYPLHPRVQRFFDDFVGKYGHSSIMELTGEPAVYTEGISWYTAYLLFDSPLCAGQEFSTRAVQHKDWPMARECYGYVSTDIKTSVDMTGSETLVRQDLTHNWVPHPALKELHDSWFEVFEAEVKWWTEHLTDEANRKALGIADKEPFRPALDRARWALPGTIATGCCHTSSLRERARVLRDGSLLAQRSKGEAAIKVWEDIRDCYTKALPGLSGMGLREAHYDATKSRIPAHWEVGEIGDSDEMCSVAATITAESVSVDYSRPYGKPSYLDASYNHFAQVIVGFQCSLAVARDWHRHRTMYPWTMDIVTTDEEVIRINQAYEPKSDLAKERVDQLLAQSWAAYNTFMEDGDQIKAVLCLPFGTDVLLEGQGGLRDAIYMLELRANAIGANFEYKAQAEEALRQLKDELLGVDILDDDENIVRLVELLGLEPQYTN